MTRRAPVLKTPRPIFSSTRALTEACCTCCVKAPGGGSNFTGSLSGTARVTPVVLASLSGFVSTSSGAGIGGAVSTLTTTNSQGQTVTCRHHQCQWLLPVHRPAAGHLHAEHYATIWIYQQQRPGRHGQRQRHSQ